MAVAEPLGCQHVPDDDHRGAPHPGGEHLPGDVPQRAAQDDLPLLAGVRDDRRGAAGAVARDEFGGHLLDARRGQVQHQRRAGDGEAGQVLSRRHRGGLVRDPGEHDRLADSRHGQLTPQGRGRGGERGHARGDVVGDPRPVQAPCLLGDRAEDGRVAGAEPDHVQSRGVGFGHGPDDLVQGEAGGVDQGGASGAVRQDLGGDEAARVQADRALLQQALGADGDQVRCARSGADEVDGHELS